jgi:outer membrane protein assembly factor BamB
MKKIITLINLLLLTTSCSDGWLGSRDKSPKLKGERIPALKLDVKLSPDQALRDLKITIPNAEENVFWASSDGGQYQLPEHLKLADNLTKYSKKYLSGLTLNQFHLTATPVIADDIIYVLNGRAKLFAYDAKNISKLLWFKNLAPKGERKEYAGGGMSIADSKLFVSAGHKEILCLDAKTGKELWRRSLTNISRSSPIVAADKVFVNTIDNRLYALNVIDGSVIWMHEGAGESVGVFGSASIALADMAVIVPHSTGQLHAVSMADGSDLWSVNLSFSKAYESGFSLNDIDVTPVIKNDRIFAASNAGLLYAINLYNSDLIWQQEIKGIKNIWVAGEFIYAVTASNEVLCVFAKDGKIKWIKSLPEYADTKAKKNKISINGPILAGNSLFVTTNNGKLLQLSPFDGSTKSEYTVENAINLPPIVMGSAIYMLTNKGMLVKWE